MVLNNKRIPVWHKPTLDIDEWRRQLSDPTNFRFKRLLTDFLDASTDPHIVWQAISKKDLLTHYRSVRLLLTRPARRRWDLHVSAMAGDRCLFKRKIKSAEPALYAELGRRLREFMREGKISVNAFAARLGVSRQRATDILRGRDMRLSTLEGAASAVGCDLTFSFHLRKPVDMRKTV